MQRSGEEQARHLNLSFSELQRLHDKQLAAMRRAGRARSNCSELPNNEGSSVTYSAHQIAAEVIRYSVRHND